MNKKIYLTILLPFILFSCNDFLEIEVRNKLPGEVLFSTPEGITAYMANLYYQLPVEDFAFTPDRGFNFNTVTSPNNGGVVSAMLTNEAIHSEFNRFPGVESHFQWWTTAYSLNRDINVLESYIPELDISDQEKDNIIGEAAFLKAYNYYALAKRYGGVPIIDELQEFLGADSLSLRVPRSTEVETWDYILRKCDTAIEKLPESWDNGQRRATKWVASALKSRLALHAASLAKYWNSAPLSGDAVDYRLIGGFSTNDMMRYYTACIEASEYLIDGGPFSLYRPNPASPEEAAINYREMFENPSVALNEAIFIKGFSMPGIYRAHNYDIWYNPNQTANGWMHPGRMNPTIDFVDLYESYDNPGVSSPIITRVDGQIGDHNGYNPSLGYRKFEHPLDIFEGKDARLFATVILPGSVWKNTPITIQGGFIRPDGSNLILTSGSVQVNGQTYYTYGAQNPIQYSGFDTYAGNMTRTGFGFKKFLQERENIPGRWNQSTTDFIDIRYAEVLLNYAEAVVESGYTENNAVQKATEALNATRRRAGHQTDIPLTLENVLRERKVELAFENKEYWDLIRRREFHVLFNSLRQKALIPILDLREDPVKYIFVRRYARYEGNKTFQQRFYYLPIPGIASNGLIQNPQF